MRKIKFEFYSCFDVDWVLKHACKQAALLSSEPERSETMLRLLLQFSHRKIALPVTEPIQNLCCDTKIFYNLISSLSLSRSVLLISRLYVKRTVEIVSSSGWYSLCIRQIHYCKSCASLAAAAAAVDDNKK